MFVWTLTSALSCCIETGYTWSTSCAAITNTFSLVQCLQNHMPLGIHLHWWRYGNIWSKLNLLFYMDCNGLCHELCMFLCGLVCIVCSIICPLEYACINSFVEASTAHHSLLFYRDINGICHELCMFLYGLGHTVCKVIWPWTYYCIDGFVEDHKAKQNSVSTILNELQWNLVHMNAAYMD